MSRPRKARHHLRRAAYAAALIAAAGAVHVTGASAGAAAQHTRIATAPRLPAAVQATGWASSNWSGYAITGGPFTSITGSWIVPTAAKTSSPTYSSSWIGIDGFNNTNLIQTGTEQDYAGGAQYGAWWEILPAPATFVSLVVHPGDHMSASISQGAANMWTISLTNTTTGKSFSTSKPYVAALSSAEWIQEAPTVNGQQANLAHYGSAIFDPGTVNGHAPGLTLANRGVMVQHNHQVSTPSKPDSDVDGFKAAYGSKTPSPPTS